MPKVKDETAREVLEVLAELRSQSSGRLANYKRNRQWFESDKDTAYPDRRKEWESEVMANIIEANVRTVVSVLTDSKPIMRVVGMPYKKLDDEQIQQMKALSENLDNVLGHIWRVNNMHAKLKQIVLDGSITGLMVSRLYWDAGKYDGIGEIGIETVHPKHIFFDQTITELNLEDGSCDWFIYAVRKPITWFDYYFPGKKIEPTEDTKDKQGVSPMADYIEAYKAEFSTETVKAVEEGKVVQHTRAVYPKGRKIVLGGTTKLSDEPLDIFPFAVEPIANKPDTVVGEDDVTRQIELQKEMNVSLARLSQHIALSANRQWVGSKECGIDPEVFLENSDRPGMFFALDYGKNVEDFRKHFSELSTPKFEPELFQYVYTVLELMEKITGVTKLIQGMASKTERQTGFEIGKMLETATIRLRERAGHVEEFIRQIGLISMEYVKKNYTEERDVWHVDESSQEIVANTFKYPTEHNGITGENVPVEYEFDIVVQPDSTLPIDLNSMADLAMRLKERGVITNQELLKRLHYPDLGAALPDMVESPQGQPAPAPPPTGAM